MAVDTRNKRSSAVNVLSPWRGMLPEPDGAIGAADRQHAAFMYSGILTGGAPSITAFFGESSIAAIYYGETTIAAAYVGETQIG